MDAQALMSPQQLQEIMQQTAEREVNEFSWRSWASSLATGPDNIALDFSEGFVLYTLSLSGCSRAVSWMGWRSVGRVFLVCIHGEIDCVESFGLHVYLQAESVCTATAAVVRACDDGHYTGTGKVPEGLERVYL